MIIKPRMGVSRAWRNGGDEADCRVFHVKMIESVYFRLASSKCTSYQCLGRSKSDYSHDSILSEASTNLHRMHIQILTSQIFYSSLNEEAQGSICSDAIVEFAAISKLSRASRWLLRCLPNSRAVPISCCEPPRHPLRSSGWPRLVPHKLYTLSLRHREVTLPGLLLPILHPASSPSVTRQVTSIDIPD